MRSKTDHTKMYPEDLNPPHRELSDGGLGFVIALLVRQEILFSFVSMDIAPPPMKVPFHCF